MTADTFNWFNSVFSNKFFALTVIIASVILGLKYNMGFPFGLAVCALTLIASRGNFAAFGLGSFPVAATLLTACGYVLLILFFVDLLLDPFLSKLRNEEVDLSAFAPLKGNLPYLLRALTMVLLVAALGEELFYRGYVFNRLGELLGGTQPAWWAAAVLSSVVFGLAHYYQGVNGMITTGVTGFILAIAFMRNSQNLALSMCIHGLYDIFGLVMLYLGQSNAISDFARRTIFNWM